MNNELKILDLYNKTNPKKISSFHNAVESSYSVSSNCEKFEVDFEWLELMETTIRYLDNILRNPNRFIINEEEIVNVEKARRVTVESIKHLSKHTNYISTIEKNGDVKPSKILNINKDESFNTYENRVIYTLIKDMQAFIMMRKKDLITSSYIKDTRKSEYQGVTKVAGENVSINVSFESKVNNSEEYGKGNEFTVEQRIERLELLIADLTRSDVFMQLQRDHVARVIPPIKKTNLILKNVNFQYAMKLWNYLQSYQESGNKTKKENVTFKDDKEVKGMFDDVFLLNYLIVHSLGEQRDINKEKNKEVVEQLTNNMIQKIVEINSDLPMENLKEVIGDKIAVIRNKKEASLSEVQNKFNSRIQSMMAKILSFSFR